jgi:NADH-quinone oxidoreductase subunit F
MGTPLRELVEDHAGGMREGFTLRALLPGGASTGFILPQEFDIPLSVTAVAARGHRLGTGTAIVLDNRTCPVAFIANLQHFFAQESCGWCAPCRDGLPWVEQVLNAIEAGRGTHADLALLTDMTAHLSPGRTFCALAPGAMASLQTGLLHFREDFENHIGGSCAWQ